MNDKHEPEKKAPHAAWLKRAGMTAAILAGGFLAAAQLGIGPAGTETTEDAYVEGNMVQITPQLAGSVVGIAADNTDRVEAGQLLVQLSDVDTRLAVERAEAHLARTIRQVRAQFATAGQMQAALQLRQSDLARAQADLARRKTLAESGAISGEELHHAGDAVESARAALAAARQQAAGAAAMTERTTVEAHPDVQVAAAQLSDAYVAQARTFLRAPVGGIVARRNAQLGQRVSPGTALMTIIPQDQMWVNANFKESQLRAIRVGQPVTLRADMYGKSVSYTGRVAGLEGGTGSAFSLLPAQNATGNWIKVVQRVPVRIALDPQELVRHPLRLGLSMRVEVDTRDGGAASPADQTRASRQATQVFSNEFEQARLDVQRLIDAQLAKPKA